MSRGVRDGWAVAVRAGSAGAVALTAHTMLNLRRLRTPQDDPGPVAERVSVLLPVRDEAATVAGCLQALLEQIRVPELEILVLDDGSTDGTAERVLEVAGGDPRVRLLRGVEPPAGWLGKPHACHQLAAAATGSVLVFVDADVQLAPHGVAAAVELLRDAHLDLVSPYPRQLALSPAERLVQPLLQWSILTTLPLRAAETSTRPSLSAANGQFLVVDAARYAAAGGHAAVRDAVLDDVALVRRIKATGGRGGVVDGTRLATCRMYDGWEQVRDGYAKSLWSAFGSPAGAAGTTGLLGLLYLVPPVAALGLLSPRRGPRPTAWAGLAGYAAAVTGRYLVAERTDGRSLPDSLAHPASVAALAVLTGRSVRGHRRGTLRWRGRPVVATDPVIAGAGAPDVRS